MTIENTSQRHPLGHILGIEAQGQTDYITGMEAAGQHQLVNSDRLPTDTNFSSDADFEALGFTFGEPDPNDPLFRPATLPEGWSRRGSDHAMWSYIMDERGIDRVAVFYKAAFYDRGAHMGIVNVGYGWMSSALYGDGPDAERWAKMTEDERFQAKAACTEFAEDKYNNEERKAKAVAALEFIDQQAT